MSPQYIPPPDADTWQPPAGMVRLVCNGPCGKPFASRGLRTCANCIAKARRPRAEGPLDGAGLRPARPKRTG